MSRYNPKPHAPAVFEAAEKFKNQALVAGQSIIGAQKIWVPENFGPLVKYYVNSPLIEDEGSMMMKLGMQLKPCPPESVALFAEIYWILLLGTTNMKAAKKRDRVRHVWSMALFPIAPFPTDFTTSPFLNDAALSGLGSAGPGFNMYQWKELQFAVIAFQSLAKMDAKDKSALLSNPWSFAAWLDNFEESDGRQFYHCLCHLLFPDEFERIFSEKDKAKAARSPALGIAASSAIVRPLRDEALYSARKALEEKMGTEKVDFYSNPPILLRNKLIKPPKVTTNLNQFMVDSFDGTVDQDDTEGEEADGASNTEWTPLNRIYFGQPGTGKTLAMLGLRSERYADG